MGKAAGCYPKNKNKLLTKPLIVDHEITYIYDSKDRRTFKTVIANPAEGSGEAISETATLDSVSLAVTNPYRYAFYRYDT